MALQTHCCSRRTARREVLHCSGSGRASPSMLASLSSPYAHWRRAQCPAPCLRSKRLDIEGAGRHHLVDVPVEVLLVEVVLAAALYRRVNLPWLGRSLRQPECRVRPNDFGTAFRWRPNPAPRGRTETP